jgi:hypothetical protein
MKVEFTHYGSSFDNANRFYAENEVTLEYIETNGYRRPSRSWPYSHAKPLMTRKFAKWCEANHPEFASRFK